MNHLYPARYASAEEDFHPTEWVRQVLDAQEAYLQAAYSALLDANTPPDIRKVAWAGRMGEFKLSPCGTRVDTTYQGHFVDRLDQTE